MKPIVLFSLLVFVFILGSCKKEETGNNVRYEVQCNKCSLAYTDAEERIILGYMEKSWSYEMRAQASGYCYVKATSQTNSDVVKVKVISLPKKEVKTERSNSGSFVHAEAEWRVD